jgi:hypothetical protein
VSSQSARRKQRPARTARRPVNRSKPHGSVRSATPLLGSIADIRRAAGPDGRRPAAGRDPGNPELINLIGQLSTHSEEFRQLWAAHDVRKYREGPKRFNHPIVGALEFVGESFEVSRQPGLVMLTYTTEPASPTAEAVALLASWTAQPQAATASALPPDLRTRGSSL